MDKKVESMITIAKKGGFVKSGDYSVVKILQEEKAGLVIVSEDASKNTKKKFNQKTFHYGVKYKEYGFREEFGKVLGRRETSVIGITDKGISDKIEMLLNNMEV